MKTFFTIKIIVLFCSVAMLFSCGANALLNIQNDGSGAFSFSTQTSENVASIIYAFSGTDAQTDLFDVSAIEESFAQANLTLSALSFPSKADIALSATSENVNKLIPQGEQPVITNITPSGGNVTIKLNKETMTSLISAMPEDTALYIDLLQAPIFTGDTMTPDEYADFIGAVYGSRLAGDITNSAFTFDIQAPGNISDVRSEPADIGTYNFSGKKASFSFLLHRFLSTSNEILLYVTWKT
ncbi:MAG: hypothetical protein R3Y36_02550 [Spirochaetales bacterium]